MRVNTVRFLKYIWPFFNIMHERVNTFVNGNYIHFSFGNIDPDI